MITANPATDSLAGRVAVVTGAGSGIGAATAEALADRGVRVCCAGRHATNVDRTARKIMAAGGEAFGLRVDVASPEDNEAMISETVARYGAVDIAHLNAAIGHWAGILDYPLEEWDRTMAVNLRGVFLGVQAAGRVMRDRGRGSIVITSSAAGLTGVRMSAAYSASKHGVLGLVKSAALELGPVGIRVNAICPGYVASNELLKKMGEELDIGSRFPLVEPAAAPRSPAWSRSWPVRTPPSSPAASSPSTAAGWPAGSNWAASAPRTAWPATIASRPWPTPTAPHRQTTVDDLRPRGVSPHDHRRETVMEEFTDRAVLITGAAQGIGLGLARAFVGVGARVALTDVDEDRLDRATAELATLAADPAQVVAHALDVRDRNAFALVVDEVEDQLGPVAVLCNNAGLGSMTPVAELGYEDWDLVLDVNLGGVVNGVQTVLPRMLRRGGPAHIVNTASGAGLVAGTNVSYVTSKFAVVGLTESLRIQPLLADRRIGVSVLCPGLVRTDVLQNSRKHRFGGSATADEEALLRRYGLDPDIVGRQVLTAIRTNALYVHTDRYIEPLIRERNRALLAALPEETDRDQELAGLLRQRISDRPDVQPSQVPGPGTAPDTSTPGKESS